VSHTCSNGLTQTTQTSPQTSAQMNIFAHGIFTQTSADLSADEYFAHGILHADQRRLTTTTIHQPISVSNNPLNHSKQQQVTASPDIRVNGCWHGW